MRHLSRLALLIALVTLLFPLIPGTALAKPQKKRAPAKPVPAQITGIYSDLRYGEISGDIGGTEIFIMLAQSSPYMATVQIAEGVPTDPVLVPVKVTGNDIEFSFPAGSDLDKSYGTYRGTITARGLTGKFANEGEKTFLKRKPSHWE